jgi:hypothetical protein
MSRITFRLLALKLRGYFKPATLAAAVLAAAACGNTSESGASKGAPALPAEFAVIDQHLDLLPDTEYGTLNGSALPAAVSFDQGGRQFGYEDIEVRAYPVESFFGEQISYRLKQSDEWRILPAEEFAFFVGYDGRGHLLVDQGSNVDNRTLQLWDVKSGRKVYSGTYNSALFKQGHLYLMRYAGQGEVENPPRCDPSRFPGGHYAFELVLALDLRNYQEHKTGQVLCTYAQ